MTTYFLKEGNNTPLVEPSTKSGEINGNKALESTKEESAGDVSINVSSSNAEYKSTLCIIV